VRKKLLKPGDVVITSSGEKALIISYHKDDYLGTMYSILIEGNITIIDESQIATTHRD
jgi:hypothetical protein|tara:strand:+ start:47 stop:220 length:174 start_codon:yes stop_codon:yes gene_type:complete